MQDNELTIVNIPIGYVLVPAERYDGLLDSETRLQMIDDMYRTNRGALSSDQLYTIMGFTKPKYETEVKQVEEN